MPREQMTFVFFFFFFASAIDQTNNGSRYIAASTLEIQLDDYVRIEWWLWPSSHWNAIPHIHFVPGSRALERFKFAWIRRMHRCFGICFAENALRFKIKRPAFETIKCLWRKKNTGSPYKAHRGASARNAFLFIANSWHSLVLEWTRAVLSVAAKAEIAICAPIWRVRYT